MPTLWIPGPTEVKPELLAAQTRPMIGHRSAEYATHHASIEERLKKVLFTDNRVFVGTCSATGMIEAALRNAVQKKVLVLNNGFFAKKWATIAEQCGIRATRLDYELGQAVKSQDVKKFLENDPEIDAVFLTHSETSTGVLSPLAEIAAVIQKFPKVVLLVDTVSSFAAAEIRTDAWGVDLVLFGMQKALALPAGLAICAVSPEIMRRSAGQPVGHKGHYFDFMLWEKAAQKANTIVTPAISLLFALDKQLDHLLAEGMEKRWARHTEMSRLTQEWAAKHGLKYFSEANYHSPAVSVICNEQKWDLAKLNSELAAKYNCIIANGYKDLKNKTFRIGHMGDHTPANLRKLLAQIDSIVADF